MMAIDVVQFVDVVWKRQRGESGSSQDEASRRNAGYRINILTQFGSGPAEGVRQLIGCGEIDTVPLRLFHLIAVW